MNVQSVLCSHTTPLSLLMIQMFITIYRNIHSGHVKRVLNKRGGPFHNKYDKIFADLRQRTDFLLHNIKYEKDTLARELLSAKKEFTGLFNLKDANDIVESQSNSNEDNTSNLTKVNEAHYIYRMLRPNSPSFFEEQASLYLKERMNELLSKSDVNGQDCAELVPISPNSINEIEQSFTTSSYTLAVASLIESLADDLQGLCTVLSLTDLPERGNTNRFLRTFDILEGAIKLRSDGSNLNEWIDKIWVPISKYLNEDLKNVTNDEVISWLNGHLLRVSNNKKLIALPHSETVKIERKLGYPYDKSCKYIKNLLSFLNGSLYEDLRDEDINSLIESMKSIGLNDWFKLEPNEIETKMLGQVTDDSYHKYGWTSDDANLSILLIDTIARNKEGLLNIESYPPDALLYLLPKSHRAMVSEAPENKWLGNAEITELVNDTMKMIDEHTNNTLSSNLENLNPIMKTPLDQLIEEEEKYTKTIGPGEVIKDEANKSVIKWKVPEGSQFDSKRNCFVRTRSGIDPQLRLDRLRSCIVERKRMRTMTKEGRVYFIRVVVAVGDGNGYFGMGVGFGNDIPNARSMGIESALKNMYFIDFDPKECLTTPVHASEYGVRITILPRPYGSGIRINRKLLPLAYLTGLDNCRIIFHGKNSWITRMRALKRALETIYSRKTACNMTGSRFVSFKNPGDYTMHWPDAWFIPLAKEYRNKIADIKNRRLKNFKKSTRRRIAILSPQEISTNIPHYSKCKYKSPIEKFITESKKYEYINTNVNKSSTIS